MANWFTALPELVKPLKNPYMWGALAGTTAGVFMGASKTDEDGKPLGLVGKAANATVTGLAMGAVATAGVFAFKHRPTFEGQSSAAVAMNRPFPMVDVKMPNMEGKTFEESIDAINGAAKRARTVANRMASNSKVGITYNQALKEATSPIASRLGRSSSMFAMAGIGAGIGALVDKKDRGRGAAIGAVAGAGLSLAARGAANMKVMPRIQKTVVKGGLLATALLLGAGAILSRSMSNRAPVSQEASQEESEEYNYSRRLQTINATGSIVMGLHGGRHGS